MSLLALILLSSSLSAAASVVYKGAGDEVVISAGSDLGNIEAITWKHNEDIAVEWYGGEPLVYRHFKDHTTLDKSTGALTISGLTRDHSGSYTAEINNKVIGTTEVQVISPVPKPTVSKQCDAKMTYCTLTCEGNTTDTEPVTYSWEIFDVLNYYKGQQVTLTKENHDPWYRCEIKNPISSETSEEFPNPFSSSNQTLIVILVLSILFLLLIGLIVGIVIHRKRRGSFSFVKFVRSITPKSNDQTEEAVKGTEEENIKLCGVSTNGVVVPAVSVEETSVQILQTSSVVPDTNTQTAVLNIDDASNPDKTSEKPDDEPETTTSEGPEALTSVGETSNESEISPDQVQTSEETPESGAQTETTTSEGPEALRSVGETSNESATDSQDQNTSSNDLQTAASKETDESAEMSNEDGTTIPLLEERNHSISVSA